MGVGEGARRMGLRGRAWPAIGSLPIVPKASNSPPPYHNLFHRLFLAPLSVFPTFRPQYPRRPYTPAGYQAHQLSQHAHGGPPAQQT